MEKITIRKLTVVLWITYLVVAKIFLLPSWIKQSVWYLFLICGLVAIFTGQLKLKKTIYIYMLYIYCFFAIISAIIGSGLSMSILISTLQFVVLMVIICSFRYKDIKKQFDIYFKAISYIIPFSVIYSLALILFGNYSYGTEYSENYISSGFKQYVFGAHGDLGYSSIYNNSNMWGLVLFFSLLYYLYVCNGIKRVGGIVISIIGIMLSNSRAIMLFCLVLFGIRIIEKAKEKLNKTSFRILLFLLTIFAFVGIGSAYTYILEELYVLDWAGRLEMWRVLLQSIVAHPILGIGFAASSKQLLGAVGSHNSYLNILAENGIVGFIIFLSMLGYILFIIYKMTKGKKLEYDSRFCILRVAFLIFIPYAFIENVFMIVEFRSALWIMICILLEDYYRYWEKVKNNDVEYEYDSHCI